MSQILPRPPGQPDPGAAPVHDQEELVAHLRGGIKRGPLRVGVEHEQTAVRLPDGAPVPYDAPRGISTVLERLAQRHGHTPVLDRGRVVALMMAGGGSVTLEPGGQIELSGAAVEKLADARVELDLHLAQLHAVAEELGIAFLALGYRPVGRAEDLPQMPKARYDVMTPYLMRSDRRGLEMMRCTCTVQANLDFTSEEDMGRKLQVALGLSGLVTALFAASPFANGRPTGWQSERMRVWSHVDATRCGLPGFALREPSGFRGYVDYALDVPLIFIRRGVDYAAPPAGLTFRRWMQGEEPALPTPTHGDFDDLLTTLFPDVRLKTYLEMRTADAGPRAHLMALPALWKGLLYDATSMARAWSLVAGLDLAGHQALRLACARDGLKAQHAGVAAGDACVELCLAAQDGLRRLGAPDEAAWVDPMLQRARARRTLADELLAHPGPPLQAALDLTRLC